MKGLMRFSITQTVFMNLVFILLMAVGLWAFFSAPVERYPAVNFGKVFINTFFPGASPQDVEALVTQKIEEALEDVDDLEFISSTSEREYSRILVKFHDDTDYRKGYDDLRLKVLSIQKELPVEVDPPSFNLIETEDAYPVVSVDLSGDRTNQALTLMAEELKSALRQIDGVREVILRGEFTREYHIILDPDKLSKFGVTFDQAARALKDANITIPAGDLDTPQGEFVILVDEQFRERSQVQSTVVRRDGDGSFVTFADIMVDAYMSHRDPAIISSVNGVRCVSLQITKTRQGNALNILKAVRRTVDEFQPVLQKEGVGITLTRDSTVEIKDSMYTLGWNLFIGVLLVSGLIWLFMGVRNAALTTVGIPFSFLVTMIFIKITGNSLNEITLFSFVLISGIVVDDAIVVVENIYRHFQEGKSPKDAVVEGTAEVFLPISAVTLTTIAAFLPMLIMTGSTGEFFAQIPKAVSFALIASVLECLFILPIHYLDFGPRPEKEQEKKEFALMTLLRKPVDRLIHFALRFPKSSLGVVFLAVLVALFIAGVSITGRIPLIRVEFFPDDYGKYYVDFKAPVGTSIERTSDMLQALSKDILAQGEGRASSVVGYAGYWLNEDYEAIFSRREGQLVVTLPPSSERRFDDYPVNDPLAHLDRIRELAAPYVELGCQIQVRPQQDGPPSGKDVNVRAVGSDAALVADLARAMMRFMKEDAILSDALIDLRSELGKPNKIFRFHIRKDRASEFGISPAQAAGLTAAALNGRYVGEFRDRDEQVDIKLKLTELKTPEEALSVPILEHPSGPVRLGDLNETELYEERGSLNRFQGDPAVAITANLATGSSMSPASVVQRVKAHYLKIQDQYPGATLNFAGEFADTRRSFTSLGYAFVIALLAIYLILATQFRSYAQPLIVLSAVPFAFIGVIFGLFFSRSLLSVNSMIAMVGVAGVVVNDSLVLIEFINKLYRSGLSRRDAVFEGVRIRLRPILLTTLTTSLAFLPMALGIPEYSLVWGSMASTFVTGLCTATFLTLFVIPLQWDLVMRFKEKRLARKG